MFQKIYDFVVVVVVIVIVVVVVVVVVVNELTHVLQRYLSFQWCITLDAELSRS